MTSKLDQKTEQAQSGPLDSLNHVIVSPMSVSLLKKSEFDSYTFVKNWLACSSTRGAQQISTSRQNKTLHAQLGKVDSRPLGLTDSAGCSYRFFRNTLSGQSSLQNSFDNSGQTPDGDRNYLHAGEGSHSRTLRRGSTRRLPFKHVSYSQKRRENETCDKLEKFKSVCDDTTFQNGRHTHHERPHPTEQLDDKNRSEGCLFHHSSSETPPKKFLRFAIENRHFQFTCLHFGLSSAPWVFTKTLKPVIARLRELGVRLVIYLNDILVLGKTPQEAGDHTLALIRLLENLGFIVHPEKSLTQPTQRVEFLGMIIDSTYMELQVPGEKLKKIRTEAKKVIQSNLLPVREISRLIGKMTSMAQAIPPAPLFYCNLQRDASLSLAKGNQQYETPCQLSPESREELQWWIVHLW